MARDPRNLLEDAAARPRGEVDVDAVRRRGRHLRWYRRFGVGSAVLAVVAAVVAVPLVLSSQPSTPRIGPPPSPETSPSGSPSDTDALSGAPAVRTGSWRSVEDPDLGEDGVFETLSGGVVTGDGEVVAVGTAQPEGGTQRGAVWRTDDLRDWTRVDDPALAVNGTDTQVNAVTATRGDGRIVAVGSVGPQRAAPGTAGRRLEPDRAELTAAVWRSADNGRSWSRLDETAVADARGAELADVTAGPSGALAVGLTATSTGSRPAVWLADADGTAWDRIETDLPAEPSVTYGPLTADGDRYVLAVDTFAAGDPDEVPEIASSDRDATLWWSGDGRRWRRAEDPDEALTGAGDQTVADLLVADGSFLAIGRESSRELPQGVDVAWSSTDGASWRRAARGLGIPGAASDFVTRGGQLVALTTVTQYATETLTGADPSVWLTTYELAPRSASRGVD